MSCQSLCWSTINRDCENGESAVRGRTGTGAARPQCFVARILTVQLYLVNPDLRLSTFDSVPFLEVVRPLTQIILRLRNLVTHRRQIDILLIVSITLVAARLLSLIVELSNIVTVICFWFWHAPIITIARNQP